MNTNSESSSKRLNEIFASTLSSLATINKKIGEKHKANKYEHAEKNILLMTKDITSYKDLENKSGFGVNIIKKLKEIEETGKSSYIERAKTDPLQNLTEIHGIGEKKAKELINKNILSREQLKTSLKNDSTLLTNAQTLGLIYYNDIIQRIPREIIQKYEIELKNILKQIDDKAILEIVGSYRREHNTSGDIDIIISHPENKEWIFSKFLDILKDKKIIIDFLSKGNKKSLTIAKLETDIARRLDFLYSPPSEYPFATLYFTGSKAFNTVMRDYAVKNGYTLNEHGIYRLINGKKGDKIERNFKIEEEIFTFLNLQYKEPKERINGNSIIPLKIEKEISNQNISNMDTIMEKMEKNMNTKKDQQPIEELEEIAETFEENPSEETEKEIEEEVFKAKEPVNIAESKDDMTALKTMNTEEILEKSISAPSNVNFFEKDTVAEEKEKAPLFIPSMSYIDKDNILKNIGKNMITKMDKKKKRNYKQLLDKLDKDGYDVLDHFSEDELALLIKRLNDLYYNGESVVSDGKYDIIKQKLEDKYPDNKVLGEIGAPVTKQKAELPYFMASMDKIKPDTKALEKWLVKYTGNYIISAKLDGISGLYTTEGDKPKLYTRGDGKIGQDISDLIPYFKFPKEKDITIRGEFIIQKKLFEDKYSQDSSNARNFVAGVINAKRIEKQKYNDVDFVAYEVIKPSLTPNEQMKYLDTLHVDNVLYSTKDSLTNEELSETLLNWRDVYKYDIDGIIVTDNKIYPRENKNPDHGFAFKMMISDQIAEANVLDVLWEPSKDGYLKPRIRIEPIILGGVKIEYATAFNGAFVEKHKLGMGAIVKLIRSGDVIPHIIEVVTPADNAQFPDVDYVWNDSHIDIILANIDDNLTVKKKNIKYFFDTLDVENLGPGIIKKLVDSNYNTISKVLEMTIADFETIPGIKEKTATKIYKSIEKQVEKANITKIMTASNIFCHSIAEKKIQLILESYPNVLQDDISDEEKIIKLKDIKGMAEKTSQTFVKHISTFLKFLDEIKLTYKLENTSNSVSTLNELAVIDANSEHELYKRQIVFTGFRDKELMNKLENKYKVKLSSAISKNTYLILAKNPEENSSKLLKAKELNIPIFSKDEFETKYPDL